MARYHYWQYIVDEQGSPLDSVEIRFYLSDQPTVEASIFLNPTTGAVTTTSGKDLQTNADGFFEFWVGDEWEIEGGYVFDQKFRLEWYKAGIVAGAIDPVDIFPPLAAVDETITGQAVGERAKKNKLISNALAYKWNNHIDLLIPSAAPHDLHPVEVCSTDNQYNKVVSNYLINRMMTAALSASTVSLDASAADMFTSVCGLSGDGSKGIYALSAGSPTGILHGLGNSWPIVQVMKLPQEEVVVPNTVRSIDNNNTLVEVSASGGATSYRVTIIG